MIGPLVGGLLGGVVHVTLGWRGLIGLVLGVYLAAFLSRQRP